MGTMMTIPWSQQLSLTARKQENAFVSSADESENYIAESDWVGDPTTADNYDVLIVMAEA